MCAADVDTDTDTTYTAGVGLNLVGTEFQSTLGTSIDSTEITDGTIVAADLGTIPVSTFTNDAGYLTSFTEVDGSTSNELNTTFALASDTLSLTDAGGTLDVDLSGYVSTDDQTLTSATLSGTTLTVALEDGGSVNVDLASIDTDTDTQLDEAAVDAFVANNGYLSTEVDGSTTNELISSANLTGSDLNIIDAGGTTTISLASLLDNTDVLAGLSCAANEVAA